MYSYPRNSSKKSGEMHPGAAPRTYQPMSMEEMLEQERQEVMALLEQSNQETTLPRPRNAGLSSEARSPVRRLYDAGHGGTTGETKTDHKEHVPVQSMPDLDPATESHNPTRETYWYWTMPHAENKRDEKIDNPPSAPDRHRRSEPVPLRRITYEDKEDLEIDFIRERPRYWHNRGSRSRRPMTEGFTADRGPHDGNGIRYILPPSMKLSDSDAQIDLTKSMAQGGPSCSGQRTGPVLAPPPSVASDEAERNSREVKTRPRSGFFKLIEDMERRGEGDLDVRVEDQTPADRDASLTNSEDRAWAPLPSILIGNSGGKRDSLRPTKTLGFIGIRKQSPHQRIPGISDMTYGDWDIMSSQPSSLYDPRSSLRASSRMTESTKRSSYGEQSISSHAKSKTRDNNVPDKTSALPRIHEQGRGVINQKMETTLSKLELEDAASTISSTSMHLTPDQTAGIVKKFTVMLLTQLQTRLSSTCVTDSGCLIQAQLETKIKEFSSTVRMQAPDSGTRIGCKIIRFLRREIARECSKALVQRSNDNERSRRHSTIVERAEQLLPSQASSNKKVSDWLDSRLELKAEEFPSHQAFPADEPVPITPPSSESTEVSVSESSTGSMGAYLSTLCPDFIDMDHIVGYLGGHPAFESLARDVQLLVERYDENKMDLIRRKVSNSLRRRRNWSGDRAGQDTARLQVEGDINDFLRTNYADAVNQDLSLALCFVGKLENAQLTTIGDYFKRVWPSWPNNVLETLKRALNNPTLNRTVRDEASPWVDMISDQNFIIVHGPEEFIITVAQQLAWLAAACRTSHNGLAFSRVDFNCSDTDDPGVPSTFFVKSNIEYPSGKEKTSCWNAVAGGTVLVSGFPIPERPEGIFGLDTQVGILSSLIGIRQTVTYRGGYILKGRFHALVPIKKKEDAIQWHLVTTSPNKLKWADIEKHCPERMSGIQLKHLKEIQFSRAILGWCTQIKNSLATKDFPYEAVEYTKLQRSSKKTLSVTEFNFGFAQFAQATTKFTLGLKQGVAERERADFYEGILDDAKEMHVFFYDTEAQRAVHTTGERAIMHMIAHANSTDPFIVDNKPVVLYTPSGEDDVREALLRNAYIPLRKGIPVKQTNSNGILLFKDKVLELYERLSGLQECGSGAPPFTISMESPSTLHGWEYMDIVSNTRRMRAKMTKLRKTSGAWPAFARDEDINGIFLFGSGFGDILKAVNHPQFGCPSYNTIPKGKDYLGIQVSSLLELYEEHGSLKDQEKLTSSGFTWHRPRLLFEPCTIDTSHGVKACECDRIQEIVHPEYNFQRLLRPKLVPPGALEATGAVIFGQSHSKISMVSWRFSSAKGQQKKNNITRPQSEMPSAEISCPIPGTCELSSQHLNSHPGRVFHRGKSQNESISTISSKGSSSMSSDYLSTNSTLATSIEFLENGNGQTRNPAPVALAYPSVGSELKDYSQMQMRAKESDISVVRGIQEWKK